VEIAALGVEIKHPSGMRHPLRAVFPALKTPGYPQRSLRDEPVRANWSRTSATKMGHKPAAWSRMTFF